MGDFINFCETHYIGIFVFLLIIFSAGLLLNWTCWIIGIGRYRKNLPSTSRDGNLMFVFANLMVKIINDFRHFLALILVIIFAVALCYALFISHGKADELTKSLQAVMSTLGGLVGSIVGYYFGESKTKPSITDGSPTTTPSSINPPIQQSDTPIKQVPPPDQVVGGSNNPKTGQTDNPSSTNIQETKTDTTAKSQPSSGEDSSEIVDK